ncbi:TAXI family TRAP transporter solute-binding subunit [Streptomyces corynorhini]|uniref:TAXI family TRAP transporter solute-binding subunit n=1 Tax=Streptomyces corynorhini TaxID=2282652 RepID=A0A370BFM5_9ACTN|nr:TAXI family TRAP transporter solute-binding subunit [Streptomyces corynorhini]RDG38235.1 hypothetical protein DVH02_10100 [Streptomyces corynorhini]
MFTFPARLRGARVLQGAAAFLVVLGLLLWWLLPIGKPTPSGSVVFSTGVNSGVYERYGKMLKDDLGRDLPEVSVTLRSSEGSQENIARVASGEAQFTIATADAVAKYQMDGKPGAERLRGCARLYDDYVQLVTAKDKKIGSVADLAGLRVGVGQERSGVRLLADRILTATGIDPLKGITPVSSGIDTMPVQLERGELDAFFWSGGLPTSTVQKLAGRFSISLVPLTPSLIAQLHDTGGASARYYRSAAMPADAYGEAQGNKAVRTIAVANLLVTTDRVSEELVKGFTRTVIKSRDRIGEKVHPAQLVDLRTAIYTDPLPLHDGAQQYYQSVKP